MFFTLKTYIEENSNKIQNLRTIRLCVQNPA
jgi:hypothetical protein